MLNRIIPAVITIVLCGSAAQCGLIVNGSTDYDARTDGLAGADAVMSWMANQDEGNAYVGYIHGPSPGMSGVVATQSPSIGVQAIVTCVLSALSVPSLSWLLSIENSRLPVFPVLDGLLKPS